MIRHLRLTMIELFIIIRNISYKELILYIYSPVWINRLIRNISYKELILWGITISRCTRQIRNISYKELILQRDITLHLFYPQLEIYPIRNWYFHKIVFFIWSKALIRNISYKELIPRNKNPNTGDMWIRNISYKELILDNTSHGILGISIRNISYKELIRVKCVYQKYWNID